MKKLTAWGLVLLAILHLIGMLSRPGSDFQEVCPLTKKTGPRAGEWGPTNQIDWVAEASVPGNILMRVGTFARTNPALESDTAFCYFRTAYVLYPRRVYLVPADEIINTGQDVRQSKFNPTPQWLQDRDVRAVMTFGDDPNLGAKPHLQSLDDWQRAGGGRPDKSGAVQ